MLAMTVLPLATLLATSFHDVTWHAARAIWTPVGFANYLALPRDQLLGVSLRNTLLFAVAAVAGQVVLGFALALLVSGIGRGRVLYRAIFILPILLPGIVVGAIWKLMLNADFGIIDQLLGLVGVPPYDWLDTASTALASVVVVDIWHWTPFCFLLFLAGIESLPRDVYEAAGIDGARFWQQLRYITLPLLLPTITVVCAFRIVMAVKVFDEVFLLTGGGPGTATEVLSFTLYQRFFTEDRAGYGSAMAVAIIAVVAAVLAAAMRLRPRERRPA
jgi:multiple sugar transport system permease protein